MGEYSTVDINEKVLKYETFINDVLKEDLKTVHQRLNIINSDVAQWMQLKSVLQNLDDSDLSNGFKTKMDIGANIFVQAEVTDASNVLIDVGCGVYVEYSILEALTFIDRKIKLLNEQTVLVKHDSARIKARIKLVLHGIQELVNIS